MDCVVKLLNFTILTDEKWYVNIVLSHISLMREIEYLFHMFKGYFNRIFANFGLTKSLYGYLHIFANTSPDG